jgi:SOS response regulatory protein OraA/RecX
MKKVSLITTGLLTIGIVGAVGIGVASAASTSASNTAATVGSSDIPRSVFKAEKQASVAAVLNTSTANVQAAHKNHTLKQLITSAGLTDKTFGQKVKTQLTSDLESKGYSQDQITIALQHKEIVRLQHKAKKDGKTT